MSQTVALRVQQNGFWMGYTSLIGPTFAYQAVDDSDSTTHDSDDSYITVGRLLLNPSAGRVSFPMFLQASVGAITDVTLRVAAKIDSSTPVLQIGFARGGSVGFHATTFTPTGSYTVATRVFSTNPITGNAWTPVDLTGLECCVQMLSNTVARARVTLISGSMTVQQETNPMRTDVEAPVTS